MAWVGALVFFGTLAVVLLAAFRFSRTRNICSVWFWLASFLAAVALAYAATFLIAL
jgi:prolipoprotein diacylglyceryltransferase